jgi:hypothetical protein
MQKNVVSILLWDKDIVLMEADIMKELAISFKNWC